MMIRANGITLHGSDSAGEGPTLVFLHYWGGTSRTWAPAIAALSGDIRAIALDARGWGGSDRPENGYDIGTMADDVAAAVAALALDRYVLVGHSMGAKVAQLLASRRPAGLSGLVLVAPSPAGGKRLPEAVREQMVRAYDSPEAIGRTIDTVLSAMPLPSALREGVIADGLAGAPVAKAAWPEAAIAEDVSADLERIAVPVLVIGGERDAVDDVEMLRTVVVPALPDATLTVIPGAGHLLPLEVPEELARRIADFHDRLGGARRPEQLPAVFDAAMNRGDVEAVMALFHPDATMRMTHGGVVTGIAGLRREIRTLIAGRPILRNTVRRMLCSGSTALLLLDWEIRVRAPGKAEDTSSGTATQVAERDADGWWRLRIANPLGIM